MSFSAPMNPGDPAVLSPTTRNATIKIIDNHTAAYLVSNPNIKNNPPIISASITNVTTVVAAGNPKPANIFAAPVRFSAFDSPAKTNSPPIVSRSGNSA